MRWSYTSLGSTNSTYPKLKDYVFSKLFFPLPLFFLILEFLPSNDLSPQTAKCPNTLLSPGSQCQIAYLMLEIIFPSKISQIFILLCAFLHIPYTLPCLNPSSPFTELSGFQVMSCECFVGGASLRSFNGGCPILIVNVIDFCGFHWSPYHPSLPLPSLLLPGWSFEIPS